MLGTQSAERPAIGRFVKGGAFKTYTYWAVVNARHGREIPERTYRQWVRAGEVEGLFHRRRVYVLEGLPLEERLDAYTSSRRAMQKKG